MLTYRPNLMLRNGHLNSIYTALFRKPPVVQYTRVRIPTHDSDFIDLDLIRAKNDKVAILCHGLEGSSDSQYMRGTSDLLSKNGFDICAMNYRYCSGEINLTPQLYHSGFTVDVNTTIAFLEDSYQEIYLVGYSLGANLVLKYLGDGVFKINTKIKKACAISVPMHLESSSIKMLRRQNFLYTRRFLKTLKAKLKSKHLQFPNHFDLRHIEKIRNVWDFDEFYTGPLNGFEDARDYYNQCSSLQFVHNIETPTLIINAKDDPFISERCFPTAKQINNTLVKTCYPKYGGHVGFYAKEFCWEERRILDFLTSEN